MIATSGFLAVFE